MSSKPKPHSLPPPNTHEFFPNKEKTEGKKKNTTPKKKESAQQILITEHRKEQNSSASALVAAQLRPPAWTWEGDQQSQTIILRSSSHLSLLEAYFTRNFTTTGEKETISAQELKYLEGALQHSHFKTR